MVQHPASQVLKLLSWISSFCRNANGGVGVEYVGRGRIGEISTFSSSLGLSHLKALVSHSLSCPQGCECSPEPTGLKASTALHRQQICSPRIAWRRTSTFSTCYSYFKTSQSDVSYIAISKMNYDNKRSFSKQVRTTISNY